MNSHEYTCLGLYANILACIVMHAYMHAPAHTYTLESFEHMKYDAHHIMSQYITYAYNRGQGTALPMVWTKRTLYISWDEQATDTLTIAMKHKAI